MKRQFYIVWNEDKTEGFVTDDRSDAISSASGVRGFMSSTVGDAFYEAYGEESDEELVIQEVEIEVSE